MPLEDTPLAVETPTETPVETDSSVGGVDDSPVEPNLEEAPIETPETPVEGEETPVEEVAEGEQPVEGAPAKQLTPQEAAADATLKAVYRENFGQIKEIIKQHPELRPAFFKAAELNQIYTTVEDAKQAKEWATQLYQFDNLYYSTKTEDKRAFLNALHENSLEPDGSSPHYDQVASLVVGDGLSNLAARIQQGDQSISRAFADIGLNGKQAMVAIQAVAAMLGIPLQGVRFSSPTPAQDGNGVPARSEHEQYLAQEVARLNAEIQSTRESSLAQTESSFYNGIQSRFTESLGTDIAKRLESATALKTQKPGFQNWVKNEIRTRTINAVRSDEFFANQMEAMSRSGNRGPEHQQQLIAALEQRARQFLPDAVREVLNEAGIQITQQKTNAARSQTGAPRREPVTSGTPGRLTKPADRQAAQKPSESYDQRANRILGIE